MSYVDAMYDRENDKVLVVERKNKKRIYKEYKANHVFYYLDPLGSYSDFWNRKMSKFETHNKREFREALSNPRYKDIQESDISPVNRCLMENYLTAGVPELNVGFFDIEADFDKVRGWAPVDDPFNKITAITVYESYSKSLLTLVIKPNTLTFDEAQEICDSIENTELCEDEKQLLSRFLDLIENVDVLVGYNSLSYDIPYMINRMFRVLGKDAVRRMCLWNQLPKKRKFIKFKKENTTYDLVGRIHLDYMDLYKKNNPGELPSYRLDYVGEIEVGENKVPYEGSLDSLYNNDFEKFIRYNRQDVDLLRKIDDKRKYINLVSQVAHDNTVPIPKAMGSVAFIEQGIINKAHSLGFCVPTRKSDEVEEIDDLDEYDDDDYVADDRPVVGAYVARPKPGMYSNVGAIDINSLYPSAIRAVNMGPETIVAQLRPTYTNAYIDQKLREGIKGADCWEGLFSCLEYQMMMDQTDDIITVDFEGPLNVIQESMKLTAKQVYDFVFDPANNVCISANGTLYRTDQQGVIPAILEGWYAGRKVYQAREKAWGKMSRGMKLDNEMLSLLK